MSASVDSSDTPHKGVLDEIHAHERISTEVVLDVGSMATTNATTQIRVTHVNRIVIDLITHDKTLTDLATAHTHLVTVVDTTGNHHTVTTVLVVAVLIHRTLYDTLAHQAHHGVASVLRMNVQV
jgi:hypothetical protein